MKRLWINLVDYLAVRAGLWAMQRLYGGGCVPPYEDDCVGCHAGRMVDLLSEIADTTFRGPYIR